MFSWRKVQVHPYTPKYSKRWPVVLPIYDGRQCPECHVPVIGQRAKAKHQRMHDERGEWEEYLLATLHKLCEIAGIRVLSPEDMHERSINEGDYYAEDEDE